MLDEKKTVRAARHPSLIPLRMTLIAAEGESPSRPPQTSRDERRALELIERMKMEYDKPLPFVCWKDESNSKMFNLQEVIGIYV